MTTTGTNHGRGDDRSYSLKFRKKILPDLQLAFQGHHFRLQFTFLLCQFSAVSLPAALNLLNNLIEPAFDHCHFGTCFLQVVGNFGDLCCSGRFIE